MLSGNRDISLKGPEGGGDAALKHCHLMPCRIEHNGTTVKTREFFLPTIRVLKAGSDGEDGRDKSYCESILQKQEQQEVICTNNGSSTSTLTASFRGRPLQGKRVKVPEGFKGHVIIKDSRIKDKNNKTFSEFTYWNWDELPSDEDTVVKALQWIDISKAIHGNIDSFETS